MKKILCADSMCAIYWFCTIWAIYINENKTQKIQNPQKISEIVSNTSGRVTEFANLKKGVLSNIDLFLTRLLLTPPTFEIMALTVIGPKRWY